jgi:DNA polymerase II
VATELSHLVCLLLGREWRDGPAGTTVTLWGASSSGAVKVEVPVEPVMFVPRRTELHDTARARRREPVELRTLQGEPVDALYFVTQRDLVATRHALRDKLAVALESDLKPSDRFLMERFVTGAFDVSGRGHPRRGVLEVEGARVRSASLPWALVAELRVTSLDVETVDGRVVSIAMEHRAVKTDAPSSSRVLCVKPPGLGVDADLGPDGALREDEASLLSSFVHEIDTQNPDLLIGWNVVEFDLTVLEDRCRELGVPFRIGRGGEMGRVLRGESGQVSVARVPGRAVLDGIATLKNATWSFERFTLEYVAQELLGRGKLLPVFAAPGIEVGGPLRGRFLQGRGERVHDSTPDGVELRPADKVAEIARLWREDPAALARYNLEDARLALAIFDRADLVRFAFSRADLVGLPLDRQGGSVLAFDHLYLPLLHRKGYVAPDTGAGDADPSPGGEVLSSVPGLHRDVLSFDFRSLYPSIIRTFRIDPLGLALGAEADKFGGARSAGGEPSPPDNVIPGFAGARFTREPSLLPEIITRLARARAEALERGDEPLSRAIKIQMNSFYGVLGTPGCRFFDTRLATSITRRGHELIRRLCEIFEAAGYQVLYGDTDSVFVRRDGRTGELVEEARDMATHVNDVLAREVREKFGLESALELRFDAHFKAFLLPTTRGTEIGSKKRYAGLVARGSEDVLVIRGMEAVRTDWTPLARRVQRELLDRVFRGQPHVDLLLETRRALFAGELDHELVFRKRARSATGATTELRMVMTVRGAAPLDQTDALDYGYYVEKQLAPACDVVLGALGQSFDAIAGAQLSLFG